MVKQNLSMIRGDTFSFDVVISDIEPSTVTSLYFTVKKKATDTDSIVQENLDHGITHVDGSTYRVRVSPEDTSGVSAGKYVYDLQIGILQDIYTVLMGQIEIIQDVTEN